MKGLFKFTNIGVKKAGVLILTLCVLMQAVGQRSRPKVMLAKQRAKIEQKIKLVNDLLSETASQTERSRAELAVLDKQISLREKLIETLEAEIQEAENEAELLSEKICETEDELVNLRKSYATTAQLTYKSFNEDNLWLAILSAESIRDAYYRILYFRQFSNYRKTQVQAIALTQQKITDKISEISASIFEKEQLIQEKQDEMEKLQASKTNKSSMFAALRNKESQYKDELEERRLALKSVLEEMDLPQISEPKPKATLPNSAIADAKEPEPATPSKPKSAPQKTEYDPTGKDIERRKGKLPWPVNAQKAVVIGKFGIGKDEYNNDIQNDGIYIRTPHGQTVTAIYDGKVTAVHNVRQSGVTVIISHGDFRTAYANLRESHVQKGASIKAGQSLGVVNTDPRSNETVFHFIIYKIPSKYLDPLKWLEDE